VKTFQRILAGLAAALIVAVAWLAWMSFVYMLGFPDGFITEQDAARRQLTQGFVAASLVAGVGLARQAFRPGRAMGLWLTVILGLYAAMGIGLFVANQWVELHLMGGAGG
jgi:predicted anti-sigma-YlaC factor YlaD